MDPKRLEGFLDGLEDAPACVCAPGIQVDPLVDDPLQRWQTAAAKARHADAEWRRCRDAAR
jgi:hypothetical protein